MKVIREAAFSVQDSTVPSKRCWPSGAGADVKATERADLLSKKFPGCELSPEEEEFVIELRASESLKSLVVNQVNYTSVTSDYEMFREGTVRLNRMKGNQMFLQHIEPVLTLPEKKKSTMQVIWEIAPTCCCQRKPAAKCFNCQSLLSIKQLDLFYSGQLPVLNRNLQFDKMTLALVDVGNKGSMTTCAAADDKNSSNSNHIAPACSSPICPDCLRDLYLYYRFARYNSELSHAEDIELVSVYNELFAEWCMLKHFCEKHLGICKQMRRNRTKDVEDAYINSKIDCDKQRLKIRHISDKLKCPDRNKPLTQSGALKLAISDFIWRSCALMQSKLAQENDDLRQFMLLEAKVMKPQRQIQPVVSRQIIKEPSKKPAHAKIVENTLHWFSSFFY